MNPRSMLALLLGVTVPAIGAAQAPGPFQWRTGHVLAYQVRNVTTVNEVVDGRKQQFRSQLDLLKRYRVTAVDARGVATLEYSLGAMRNEQTRPDGEVLLFDSSDPEKSTPGLREQLTKYVGKTLAVFQIDRSGKVVAVKQGGDTRYEAEPPFTVVFGEAAVKEGQAWTRDFNLTLEPPLGTGEKIAAQQKYRCTKLADGKATIALTTTIKAKPESPLERIALMQKETAGEVIFDVDAGRLVEVRLTIDRTVENHQGKGSSHRFESKYTEKLVGR